MQGLMDGIDARLTEMEGLSDNSVNEQTKKVASDYMWEELYSYIDVSQDISDDIKPRLYDISYIIIWGHFSHFWVTVMLVTS